MNPSLWEWAAQAYGRPGVEAACLALQDEHGQCVSLLLWALWAAAHGRAPPPTALAEAVVIARPWEEQALRPLRLARRGMKADFAGLADADRQALRARVQQDELQAERVLLNALETIDLIETQGPIHALEALLAPTTAWGGDAPPLSALERLAGPFSTP